MTLEPAPESLQGPFPEVRLSLPSWIESFVVRRRYRDEEDRMRLAVDLSLENVRQGTGGPFGAAIFTEEGFVAGVGVNGVTRLLNSMAHAEVVAIMMAQRPLHAFSLRETSLGPLTLYSSCDPCLMCLGATLWSGVSALVTGASKEDAEALGFDEGPVTAASYDHLVGRGIAVRRGVLREEARKAFLLYRDSGGEIY